MKRFIVLLLSLVALCLKGQTVYNLNVTKQDGTVDEYLTSAIDSITFDFNNVSGHYIQTNWLNNSRLDYNIEEVHLLEFSKSPAKFATDFDIEGSVTSIITTNGDYAFTIKDTINNNGYLSVFGNIDSEENLYVKLDSCALIRSICFDSKYYFVDYCNDSIDIIKPIGNDIKAIRISLDVITQVNTQGIDCGWPRFCRLISNILQQDSIDLQMHQSCSPVYRIAQLSDTISMDGDINHCNKRNVKAINRTVIGDLLFLRGVMHHVLSLLSADKLAIVDILMDLKELEKRCYRANYLGWWDVSTLAAEKVKSTSAVLPCEVIGFNPIGLMLSSAQCTMNVYHNDNDVVIYQNSKEVSGTGKLSFSFSNLSCNTTYRYQPILLAYYYTTVGGASNISMNDIFSDMYYIAPVQDVFHKLVQIDGVEMSFTTLGPTAMTGEASNITDKSAQIECTYSNVPENATCGVEYSCGDNTIRLSTSSSDGSKTISLDGLQPVTTYDYRAYIETNGKVYYGETKTFTTSVPDITGSWSCKEIHYKFNNINLPYEVTYTLTLNEDGTVSHSEYSNLPTSSWSFGVDGSIHISVMTIAEISFNSGKEWKGTVNDIKNPTKFTGTTAGWNFNQNGYYQGDSYKFEMTR